MRNLLLITTLIILTASCRQTGYLKYKGKTDEIIATNKIKKFMKDNESPSIVLRVPKSEQNATQEDPNAYIYNSIEKELVLAGFDVKDRGLFNEVVSKSEETNYKELKKLTETDLILELVQMKFNIKHKTNKFYTKRGKEKIASRDASITKTGAVIEFKLIILEKNDYGGSYSFYYTPCNGSEEHKADCKCKIAHKGSKIYPEIDLCKTRKKKKKEAFEIIDKDLLEEFVRKGVKQMVEETKAKV
ncbi:hypothetical protein [Aureispira anguillae]|uniref:Lipoprotein n=1 Tax=Aureispira anguillae TaxID=2864201 RepID=A0A916DNS8_9BACT|nr:hypothetical protein [Aureispira anguillae]BDS10089.1 hypothetical protein AsAng_0007960 [Aureispira anguillae]